MGAGSGAEHKKVIAHVGAAIDYPEVDCATCWDNWKIDHQIPPCKTDQGCWIPPVDKSGRRVLDFWNMCHRLKGMVDSGTVCRAFEREYGELDWSDMEMMAAVEDFHRDLRREQDNGEGR